MASSASNGCHGHRPFDRVHQLAAYNQIVVTVLESQLDAVRGLCRRHHVKMLEAFGSAVTGAFDPATSDLDFLVRFEPMPVHDYANNYFDLKEALEQLFVRPVDLVEAAPLSNPYFIAQIQPTRTPLYAA
jgi:uncharacterized protein